MALGPLSSELIRDPEFDQLIASICKHPQMYVNPATLGGVCAWIDGFNHGRGGSPLLGLREWLVVRARGGNNLHWTGLAFREIAGDRNADYNRGDDPELITKLGQFLQDFLAYREANGLSKIFWDYAEWLRRQEWYSGPLTSAPSTDAS